MWRFARLALPAGILTGVRSAPPTATRDDLFAAIMIGRRR
jgi:hypothetical protein